MATLREWFKNKSITSIIFYGDPDDYGMEGWEQVPRNQLLTCPGSHPFWDIDFDTDYGSQAVPSFHAWDRENVYMVHEYDGSTQLREAPRNPTGML